MEQHGTWWDLDRVVMNSPSEDLGNASVGDLEDPRDIAGPRAGVGQLDNLLPRRVGQWPAVDVNSSELIYAAMPCRVSRIIET